MTLLEYLPTRRAARGRRGVQGAGALASTGAASRSITQRALRSGVGHGRREGRLPDGRQGGRGAGELRAEQMLVATGRAPNSDNVGLEVDARQGREGLRPGRRPHAHRRAAPVRHRRRHRRPAAGARRRARGHRRRSHDRRRRDRDGRLPQDAARDLFAAADRVDRPDRRPNASATASTIKTGKFPFQAVGKALIGGEYEGFVKVIADKKTDEVLGVHMIGPHVTDLIAEASDGHAAGSDRLGDRAPRSTRTRRCPRRSARRRWPSTASRSTSRERRKAHGDQDARPRQDRRRRSGRTSGCRATTCSRCTG